MSSASMNFLPAGSGQLHAPRTSSRRVKAKTDSQRSESGAYNTEVAISTQER